MKKPTLKNQLNSSTYNNLLHDFAEGVPISSDKINFLYRHEKLLSTYGFDPILKYYLKPYRRNHDTAQHSFILPNDKLTKDNLPNLYHRLKIFLQGNDTHVEFNLSPEEFTTLKHATIPELIFYHGNHFLTGAPYYHGGIPHVIFFQWGNLFGVAKYVILPEERALKSNLLIYIEDMRDRFLNQCVNEYLRIHHHEFKPIPQLQNNAPQQRHAYSPYKLPRLTLAINTDKKKSKYSLQPRIYEKRSSVAFMHHYLI